MFIKILQVDKVFSKSFFSVKLLISFKWEIQSLLQAGRRTRNPQKHMPIER